MDNPKKAKGSFFKRPSDESPSGQRPSSLDNSDYQDDAPQSKERTPRSSHSRPWDDRGKDSASSRPASRSTSRPSSARDERGNRPARSSERSFEGGGRPSSSSRGDRSPRTPGSDFRKKVMVEAKEAPENVIYGIHPVREAIEIGTAIEKIYVRRSGDDRENGARSNYDQNAFGRQTPTNNAALDAIRDMAAEHNIPVQEVPVEKLDRLTRRNPHQGVVAVVPAIEYADIDELIEKLEQRDVPALIIVVDGVTDVRNFGAIARSAECAGADALIMGAKNAAPVNSEAMKSSAGALSIIPVCRVGSIRNTLKKLQISGMQLVAATEKSSDMIFEADMTLPTVLIMGGEERGISGDVLNMCDKRIAIPLLGKIESLNVSAAAAVLLYEAVRQRFNAIEE